MSNSSTSTSWLSFSVEFGISRGEPEGGRPGRCLFRFSLAWGFVRPRIPPLKLSEASRGAGCPTPWFHAWGFWSTQTQSGMRGQLRQSVLVYGQIRVGHEFPPEIPGDRLMRVPVLKFDIARSISRAPRASGEYRVSCFQFRHLCLWASRGCKVQSFQV